MEGIRLPRKWLAIAKTEFFVQTSKFRKRRKIVTIILLAFGIIWALFIMPEIMASILNLSPTTQMLLQFTFPGLIRSAMLFLWVIFLVYPISYALQEIRIGQWEIMLSNNVSTRAMMFGMFIGKIPSYGLLTLFVAPIVLTPFTLALQVSLLGQIIMYMLVFFVTISTLFLSTLITTAIQAKLGESSRGNDIAKALAMVVAVIVIVPMYGLMYFAGAMSAVLGMDVFLLFPFTWGADIISWSIVLFNNINLPAELFVSFFKLTALGDLVLLLCFTGLIVFVAYTAADRIFTFGAGPRTEKITTVGKDNVFLKGIRRLYPGSFGILVVNAIKEFSRKMQNVSRLAYGVAIAVLLPVIVNYSVGSIPEEIPPEFSNILLILIVLMQGMILSMIGGMTFGGIGFLESKDQLWIIKSAPNGVKKFGKARIVESCFLALPIALIPSVACAIIFRFDIIQSILIIAYAYWATIGSVLFATGVTANNPAYEDQKSSAFYINTFVSIFGIMGIFLVSLLLSFQFLSFNSNIVLFMIMLGGPLFVIGIISYMIGIARMSRVDTK